MATCNKCQRHWTSLSQAHCQVCCAHFSSVNNFDAHNPNIKGCADPASNLDKNGEPKLRLVPTQGTGELIWRGPERTTPWPEKQTS